MTCWEPVLVAVDFSNDSRLALRLADFQAHQWRADLLLLYVNAQVVNVPMKKNPLLDVVPDIKFTPPCQRFSILCPGDPVKTIVKVAGHFKACAIFMGYGQKGDEPGRVASGVRTKFKGHVELCSETLAGRISQPV